MSRGAFTPVQQARRNRSFWVVLIAAVIVFGLGTRSPAFPLPRTFAGYTGDAAWALGVFLGYGFLIPRFSTKHVAIVAAVTSLVVEFSQLYHAQWLDCVRSTTLGHLVLGSGFDPIDLLCYGSGIGIGALIELGLFRLAQKRSSG
jgi:Protein of unknown function (DUF2809)